MWKSGGIGWAIGCRHLNVQPNQRVTVIRLTAIIPFARLGIYLEYGRCCAPTSAATKSVRLRRERAPRLLCSTLLRLPPACGSPRASGPVGPLGALRGRQENAARLRRASRGRSRSVLRTQVILRTRGPPVTRLCLPGAVPSPPRVAGWPRGDSATRGRAVGVNPLGLLLGAHHSRNHAIA